MIALFADNIGNIVVLALLAGIVFMILRQNWRRKKSGKPSCGSCSGCAAAPLCHSKKIQKVRKQNDIAH